MKIHPVIAALVADSFELRMERAKPGAVRCPTCGAVHADAELASMSPRCRLCGRRFFDPRNARGAEA